MSYQEKKSVTSIVTSTLVLGIYSFITYQRYLAGNVDTSNIVKFWAIFIVVLIPISIIGRIVSLIIFHILNEVVNAAKGEESDVEDIMDERDKLIELKATRNSMVVFTLTFMLAMLSQVVGMEVSALFIILIIGGFISDIFSSISEVIYYRKGV